MTRVCNNFGPFSVIAGLRIRGRYCFNVMYIMLSWFCEKFNDRCTIMHEIFNLFLLKTDFFFKSSARSTLKIRRDKTKPIPSHVLYLSYSPWCTEMMGSKLPTYRISVWHTTVSNISGIQQLSNFNESLNFFPWRDGTLKTYRLARASKNTSYRQNLLSQSD